MPVDNTLLRAALSKSRRPSATFGTFPFIDMEDLAYKLRNNAAVRPLLDEAAAEADRYSAEPAPRLTYSLHRLFEATGDRMQYQRAYFGRRARMAALAAACLTEGGVRFTEAAQDMIWDICDEYTWCLPAHLSQAAGSPAPPETVDLFAAETAHMLAEIMHLLGGVFEPAVMDRVRQEIERRVFLPMESRPFPAFSWETADHNWASVCAGSVGMAALLLIEDGERLTRIVERTLRTMDCFLSGYGEDGGCAEGVAYWEYGFGFYVYFADMLHAFTDGAVDLIAGSKINAIAAFPGSVQLSGSVFANYSDSPERAWLHPGLLSRLAERTGGGVPLPFKAPGFHDDHCYRWAPFIRNAIWTDRSRFTAGRTEGFRLLTDLQWLVDRRESGGEPVAFSAKGGHNGEPHNHNDLGHFIVHACGDTILSDLGQGLYTKDYFGAKRYNILCNSSAGHSVPVVNGCLQAAGAAHRAVTLHAAELATGAELRLDLAKAYPGEARLSRFIRSFRWEQEPEGEAYRLALEDDYRFDGGPGAWEERLVSKLRPVLSADGTVVWDTGRARLTLRFDERRFAAEIEAVEHRNHAGDSVVVYLAKLLNRQPEAEAVHKLTFILETARER